VSMSRIFPPGGGTNLMAEGNVPGGADFKRIPFRGGWLAGRGGHIVTIGSRLPERKQRNAIRAACETKRNAIKKSAGVPRGPVTRYAKKGRAAKTFSSERTFGVTKKEKETPVFQGKENQAPFPWKDLQEIPANESRKKDL